MGESCFVESRPEGKPEVLESHKSFCVECRPEGKPKVLESHG